MNTPWSGHVLGTLRAQPDERYQALRARAWADLMKNRQAALTVPEKTWCNFTASFDFPFGHAMLKLNGTSLRRKVMKTIRRKRAFKGLLVTTWT